MREQLAVREGNRAIAENYFSALRSGDIKSLGAAFSDDIIWHQPGSSQLSRTYRGKDEVFSLFGKFSELSGGTFKIDEVKAIMTNGDLVSAILHFSAKRAGETMSMVGVDLMRVDDGKIKEMWLFSSDPEAEDRFWG